MRYLKLTLGNVAVCLLCVVSSASATLTGWTNEAAWLAAVNPQWHMDFPEGPRQSISSEYYASSGIHLRRGNLSIPPSGCYVGSTDAQLPYWESRGVVGFSEHGFGMLFDAPITAFAAIVPTGGPFEYYVRYANSTSGYIEIPGQSHGWRFYGVTSTIPIIAITQTNSSFDKIWLSNGVPAPSAIALLAFVGLGRRRVRVS